MTWHPEIVYEEEDGISSKIPFIPVPRGESMPSCLFILESRETGEIELGPNGENLPVVEMDLHQYADMTVLKSALSAESYDQIRAALGLEPLALASSKGEKITNTLRKNLE